MKLKKGIIALGLLSAISLQAWAQQLKGVVIDKNSKETLVGAVISIEETGVKAVTDVNGNFSFDGLKKDGTYTLYIKYVRYKTLKIDRVQMKDANLTIALQPDEQQLKGITVTAVERRNTDAAMIQVAKHSPVIVSNVSAQEISRTQDTNAGEVIRRVPGVSLIDDKFVMVRGLSQRYNHVWVNGGAVPSSEADSRAFSFDIIPSSQIDNLTIVKSPTAEYPADYSGGFIIVNTKEIPAENSFSLSVGGNWNTASAFKDFSYSKGSGTDFLGFDNGLRSIHGGINASLAPQLDASGNPINEDNYATSLLGNHLNNDWMVKSKKPIGDLKLAASLNHRWNLGGRTLGMLAARYDISCFATADGYTRSKTATAKLYWISANIETDGIAPATQMRGVVVSTEGGIVTLSGLKENERVTFYNVSGMKLGEARALNGQASISASDDIIIARIGSLSIKVKR